MTTYTIEPTAQTVHTFFSPTLEPVLTIQSGDTVLFKTLDAAGGLEPPRPDGKDWPRFKPQIEGPHGHFLCGPVYIEGAQRGQTLAVKVDKLEVGSWGWTRTGGGPFADPDEMRFHVWELDGRQRVGKNQFGHTVAIQPFLGVMGVSPPEAGPHSTRPPRIWGGNIDCKELTAGSTLYVPIGVEGALFSAGDGHALQGDGEVSGTAIECGVEAAALTFTILDDMPLTTARADTAAGFISFGFDEDLNIATQTALNDMLEWMSQKFDLNRNDALALASVVVDLRITQIANQVHGVHAVLPHGAWW